MAGLRRFEALEAESNYRLLCLSADRAREGGREDGNAKDMFHVRVRRGWRVGVQEPETASESFSGFSVRVQTELRRSCL